MKNLGPVNKYLGLDIHQIENIIFISLAGYIEKRTREYKLIDVHLVCIFL